MTRINAILICLVLVAPALAADLNELATIKPDTVSRRGSSFNPTGDNFDNFKALAPKASAVLLDVDGPGRINHMWLTYKPFPNHATVLRDLIVRMTWEGAAVPAVEVPLGDFFALGHAREYNVDSAPITVGGNTRALNCYWPMPFHRHAKVEIYNNGLRTIRLLYYHVDYELGPQSADQGLFHALFRYERDLKTQEQEGNILGQDNYVILDTEGEGQYVGCTLCVDAPPGGWWGEGDDMIFIDGSKQPTINGTGTEDYFNNAWGFSTAFCYPYYGCPLLDKRPDGGTLTTVYRWHIPDPVRFKQHIRVTMEHVYAPNVANDYSSVAYWYQRTPITSRPSLPYAEANLPKLHVTAPAPAPRRLEVDGTELEATLRARKVAVRCESTPLAEFTRGGWLRIDQLTTGVELPIPVPVDGTYRVRIKPVSQVLDQPIRIGLKGGNMVTFEKRPGPERRVPYLDLGWSDSKDKTLTVVVEGGPTVGIDSIRLERKVDPAEGPEQPAAPQPKANDADQ